MAASSGLLRVLEAVARRDCLVAFCYHRIGDPASGEGDPNVFSATAEDFEAHIRLLRTRYAIVGQDEALEWLARPSAWKGPRFLITFDDGYLDNYEVAVPILKAHGATATFFLATSFVGTSRLPWWDQIALLLKTCGRTELCLSYPRETRIALGPGTHQAAVRQVLRLLKSPETRDVEAFVRGIEEACGRPLPETSPTRLFVTWEEAADMVRQGMFIGSHTHSHPMLAKQAADDQAEEARHSRRLIEEQLGIPCRTLAYPVGSRTSFSDVTHNALAEAGYEAAFSMYGGVNLPASNHPFDLQRLPVAMDIGVARFRLMTAVAASFGRQI